MNQRSEQRGPRIGDPEIIDSTFFGLGLQHNVGCSREEAYSSDESYALYVNEVAEVNEGWYMHFVACNYNIEKSPYVVAFLPFRNDRGIKFSQPFCCNLRTGSPDICLFDEKVNPEVSLGNQSCVGDHKPTDARKHERFKNLSSDSTRAHAKEAGSRKLALAVGAPQPKLAVVTFGIAHSFCKLLSTL